MVMLINLYIEFVNGPKTGMIMYITCLGVENFLCRMSEMSRIAYVHVIGFEVFVAD
jgi:hypothetical protein